MMSVVRPIVIDNTVLVSTNVVSSAYPAYSSATTYNKDDIVLYGNYNYQTIADGILNIAPTDDAKKWIKHSVANEYAVFDDKLATQTQNANSITYTLSFSVVQSHIAFLNIDADSVNVTMNDANDGEVYNKDYNLLDVGVNDWYEFFFEDVAYKNNLVVSDLPPYPFATMTFTITKINSTAKIGAVVIGSAVELGLLNYTMNIGITDYSSKNTDIFGNVEVIERGYTDDTGYNIEVSRVNMDSVKRFLASLRKKITLFIGDENMPETITYGYYDNFAIRTNDELFATCDIQVEGVING